MAELSDFLPKTGEVKYITDLYDGTTVTSSTTTRTSSSSSVVSVSDKGILDLRVDSTTATITVIVDGVTFTGTAATLCRMFGQRDFGTVPRVIVVPFKESIDVSYTGMNQGIGSFVTATVST